MAHTVLFVGGGSIGHIAPAVAVAQSLKEIDTDFRIHFVCGPRPEEGEYIRKEGFSFDVIHAPRLSLSFVWKFWKAYFESDKILKTIKPSLVFSKGGYVSLPFCFAAKKRGIPIVLHESDATSGRANSIVGKWAEKICSGFPHVENAKCSYTGNPIRSQVTTGNASEGFRVTGLSTEKPILLVMGGSQGSLDLNEAIKKNADELLSLCSIIHLTGHNKTGLDKDTNDYYSQEFATTELPHMYAIATLALTRAGAGGIGELAANGIPGIVVPLRGVAHDHQLHNAKAASESGGFVHLEKDQLDDQLIPTVKEILEKTRHKTMSESVLRFHKKDAAGQIARIVSQTLAEKKQHP